MTQGRKWVVYSAGVVILAVIVMLSLPRPNGVPQSPEAPPDPSAQAASTPAAEAEPTVVPPRGTWTWPDPPKERRTLAAETTSPPASSADNSNQGSASSSSFAPEEQTSPTQSNDSLQVIPFPEDSEVSAGAEDTKSDTDKGEVKPTGRNSALRAILERKGKR